MTHYKKYYDKEYLGHWDLPDDRDAVVTIEKVEAGKVSNGTKTNKKPIISFVGKEKKMVLNATNGSTIADLYGPHVEKWVGKKVALYRSTTQFGRDQVECVRIRNRAPADEQKRDEAEVAQ